MNPLVVTLKPLHHRNKLHIAILYDFNTSLNNKVRQVENVSWSKTHRCWYIPYNAKGYTQIIAALEQIAFVDISLLKQYQKDNKLKTYETKITKPIVVHEKTEARKQIVSNNKISSSNLAWFEQNKALLELKAYSPATIKTYQNELRAFFLIINKSDASTLGVNRVKDYIHYCLTTLQLSENTVHSRLNALKFFYEQLLGKEKFFVDIPRPKKHLLLPKLLSEIEIERLFNALTNKKHKAILFTVYSAGLRVSEVVNLKLADVDSGRMQLFISNGKGKKDRYVNLSPVLLDILRQYIKTYKPRPKLHLFESEQTGLPYPTRTIQQIFTTAKIKAKIAKTVGVHSLRHSFATHLLEKGTDIKYIKDLLGHFDIRTTEIYLHVAKKSLVNIVSPLDDLWKNGKIEW